MCCACVHVCMCVYTWMWVCVQHGCKCMCGGGGQRYMPNVFSVAFHCTFWVSFLLNLKLIDYLASRFQGPSCQVFSLSHRPLGCRLVRGAEDPDADVTSCSHRRCLTDWTSFSAPTFWWSTTLKIHFMDCAFGGQRSYKVSSVFSYSLLCWC